MHKICFDATCGTAARSAVADQVLENFAADDTFFFDTPASRSARHEMTGELLVEDVRLASFDFIG
jgi:hypothetical protein